MNTHTRKKMMAALAAVGILGGAWIGQARPAPEFTLTDSNGNTHSLADFKGHYVVLEWINHDCPFVKKFYNAGKMQDWQQKYAEKDVVWLSICSSAPGKQGHLSADGWNEITAKMEAAPAAVLIDEDGGVGKAYEAKTTPHMFVINPEGEIIYEGAIDDKPTTKIEDIEGATNYVKAALKAAMAGEPVETASTPPYGCSVKY